MQPTRRLESRARNAFARASCRRGPFKLRKVHAIEREHEHATSKRKLHGMKNGYIEHANLERREKGKKPKTVVPRVRNEMGAQEKTIPGIWWRFELPENVFDVQ